MKIVSMKTVISLIYIAISAAAQVPYGNNPDWESTDYDYGTGAALYDFDRDGDYDLLTSNGNDMAENRERVYTNTGSMLETAASWQSDDLYYGCQLDLADVNGDGYLDMAVANMVGGPPDPPVVPALDEIYFNRDGVFENVPSWYNSEADFSFSCAFGDYDLDGDPDLATISGYIGVGTVKIYRNDGGSLSSTATWESASATVDSCDVDWCDIDRDGDLDLIVAGCLQTNKIYENVNGVISTAPTWESADITDSSLAFADVDGDGFFEMAVCDLMEYDYDLGRIQIYDNVNGTLQTTPYWQSDLGNAFAVRFADIDHDGDYDFAAGGLFSPIDVYLNDGSGSFPVTSDWSYITDNRYDFACEQIVFSDVDCGDIRYRIDRFDGDGNLKLYYADRLPILDTPTVTVDGRILDFDEYCYDLEYGWVSLGAAPPPGTDNVIIEYEYSASLDIAMTNWRPERGNFVFLNSNDEGGNLISFTGTPVDEGIVVIWEVDTVVGHEGYNLYRAVGNGGIRSRLNDSLILTDDTGSYLDTSAEVGLEYFYWLEEVTASDDNILYGPISVRPGSFDLAPAWPNPSGREINFAFALPYRSSVSLSIYDIKGRAVAEVCRGEFGAGKHTVTFSGRLTSGVYLYRLETDGFQDTKKLIVTR